MEKYNELKRVAMAELHKLDTKYSAGKEDFTPEDLKAYDCLMHGLKCHLTVCAMMEAEEEPSMMERASYGRSPRTGRYTSGRQEYRDGFNEGYSEAMNQVSGHWPMTPSYGRNIY